ncbi:CatB-related O-acetyltransferase [Salinicoccus roseus]|uniref:CatB-related O-acetyltransferase n=1 Tax=Salinicoccus roseus TaxID=45670 RepID=UPI001CA634C3|nr:CatB-related O-acetyltransferase [Salinicoccus roseus]MBY8908365.1 CatB-related O-acetyltransferase [Salinicoccus roseus]
MSIKYILSKFLQKIQLPSIRDSYIYKNSAISSRSHVVNSRIKNYSYVGVDCTIVNSEIGKFCSIANNVVIGGAEHPKSWVSTSPVFHEGKNILKKNFSDHTYSPTKKTIIMNDVWIGNHCLIKSGVKICNGAIIGMGSVVTKDIGPYEIWAGNPAKLIKKRFSQNIINELERIQWWNFSEFNLEVYAEYSNDVEKFIENVERGFYENSSLG